MFLAMNYSDYFSSFSSFVQNAVGSLNYQMGYQHVYQSFGIDPKYVCNVFFFAVYLLFSLTEYQCTYIHLQIYSTIIGFGRTFSFEPIYQFHITLFWFFGINGPAVTNTVFNPIHLALTTENLERLKQDSHYQISLQVHLGTSLVTWWWR